MDKVEVGDIFLMENEDGQEEELEVLGTAEINGVQYAAVSFSADLESLSAEDIELFFLRVEEDGELSEIESDEEFNEVTKAFDSQNS
ncbi:DUF1292 domain-containing protein [Metabacillus sp. GX 13764]|uniref:DUF1292 domain-containing protein n=1 Tax=Metabacillus kandeliae TaxID=2900151 RepID=UPI001E2FC9EF|nr:DUF1292 domain-containing protein [Metabacillus kandeliae]MCD7033611.1 DUF1292 domain-containing protein [Metabacillus kandeliae]